MELLQVAIYTPDGEYIGTIDGMELALEGSEYSLDRQQTEANDGIAMIVVASEDECDRLMDIGEIVLPSGHKMEIPSY